MRGKDYRGFADLKSRNDHAEAEFEGCGEAENGRDAIENASTNAEKSPAR
jgi:hypothetical protein